MTAPMVDYKIHWLKMMSVPQSRAVVGRHDGINGRDRSFSFRDLGVGRTWPGVHHGWAYTRPLRPAQPRSTCRIGLTARGAKRTGGGSFPMAHRKTTTVHCRPASRPDRPRPGVFDGPINGASFACLGPICKPWSRPCPRRDDQRIMAQATSPSSQRSPAYTKPLSLSGRRNPDGVYLPVKATSPPCDDVKSGYRTGLRQAVKAL